MGAKHEVAHDRHDSLTSEISICGTIVIAEQSWNSMRLNSCTSRVGFPLGFSSCPYFLVAWNRSDGEQNVNNSSSSEPHFPVVAARNHPIIPPARFAFFRLSFFLHFFSFYFSFFAFGIHSSLASGQTERRRGRHAAAVNRECRAAAPLYRRPRRIATMQQSDLTTVQLVPCCEIDLFVTRSTRLPNNSATCMRNSKTSTKRSMYPVAR